MSVAEASVEGDITEAAAFWQAIIARAPTVFGRLIRVSSCRIPGSNQYHHPALEQAFSAEIAAQVLELSHCRYFDQWLAMGIQERLVDFAKYVETVPSAGRPGDFLRDVGSTLLPPSTNTPQRYRFDSDLAVVLVLLD